MSLHYSLKNSDLFVNLTEQLEDNERTEENILKIISNSVMKYDVFTEIKIEKIEDLFEYMRMMRRWMIKELPVEFYDYLINNYDKNKQIIDFILKTEFFDFFYEETKKFLYFLAKPSCSPISIACMTGNINLLKALIQNNHHLLPHEKKYQSLFFNEAVTKGHMHIVQFLTNIEEWNVKFDNAKLFAIMKNNLVMLEYLHKLNPDVTPNDKNKYFLREALIHDHTDIFLFLQKKNYPVDEDIEKYAELRPHCPIIMKALEGIKV